MNVLESILNFLTTLARILFPRKSKPAADGTCPRPNPLPAPDLLPLAPVQGHPGRGISLRLTHITGCCLMLTGAAGCLYKWFV